MNFRLKVVIRSLVLVICSAGLGYVFFALAETGVIVHLFIIAGKVSFVFIGAVIGFILGTVLMYFYEDMRNVLRLV